ncbi:MAG: hypothetical protein CMG75_09500 [Candidatus Marinimicrobia bacterium]|nr:hypothetical protein [Candidatus Neomarinimicrobiota bacterium]
MSLSIEKIDCKRLAVICSIIAASITEIGCEDDPILNPQTSEEEKGSYGFLFIEDEDNSLHENSTNNPELF